MGFKSPSGYIRGWGGSGGWPSRTLIGISAAWNSLPVFVLYCESCSIVSDSLRPHGLYSPWNSPGQSTGVGSCSPLQGTSQPRDWTQVSRIAGRFFTSWATREAQEHWSGEPIPSPVDVPDPGVKPGSPALQVDSLPAEPPGKPFLCLEVPQIYYLNPVSLVFKDISVLTKWSLNNLNEWIIFTKHSQNLPSKNVCYLISNMLFSILDKY